LLKLVCPSDPKAAWLVSDRSLLINEYVTPERIPAAARQASAGFVDRAGFFWAVRDDAGKIIIGRQASVDAKNTW
jgi:hypothetical protein